MTTAIDTKKSFNALVAHCIQLLENSGHELGIETAAKMKAAGPLQRELEIQHPTLPFAPALNAMENDPFQPLISEIMHHLSWSFRGLGDWDMYTPDAPVAQAKFSWKELIGPTGIVKADDTSMGFYWQDAGIPYPKHRHNAEELYYVLSGNALWYSDSTGEQMRGPGSSFIHSSMEDHATTTQAEPIFAMWAWGGDLGSDSYSKDSH